MIGSGSGQTGANLEPLAWWEEDPEVRYLSEPYLPQGFAVVVVGEAESGKSLWVLSLAAELSRQGREVVVVSQENPRAVEVGRLQRLDADPNFLRMYHGQNLDLADESHRTTFHGLCQGKDLVVIDTLTECWSGKENDAGEVTAFFSRVVGPLKEQGSTVVVIHHVGHLGKQSDSSRLKTTGAARGSAAIGQKADAFLMLKRLSQSRFLVTNSKFRGALWVPDAGFEIVDTADGRISVVPVPVTDGRVNKVELAKRAIVEELSSGDDARRGVLEPTVMESAGVSTNAFNSALKGLLAEQRVERVSWGVYRLAPEAAKGGGV